MSDHDDSERGDTPDDAARGGSGRYGKATGPRGSGHQESKKLERKDEKGFVPRQGGDQSTHGQTSGEPRHD